MNCTARSMLLTLVTWSVVLWAVPVQAQVFKIRKDELPDASHIERSRLKLQIVDTSPEITVHTKHQDQTEYVLNISPIQQDSTTPTAIQVTETPGVVHQSGIVPTVVVAPNHLQPAQFGTNLPGHTGNLQRILPGTSTRTLARIVNLNKPPRQTEYPHQTRMPFSNPRVAPCKLPNMHQPRKQRLQPPFYQTSLSARGMLLRSK